MKDKFQEKGKPKATAVDQVLLQQLDILGARVRYNSNQDLAIQKFIPAYQMGKENIRKIANKEAGVFLTSFGHYLVP